MKVEKELERLFGREPKSKLKQVWRKGFSAGVKWARGEIYLPPLELNSQGEKGDGSKTGLLVNPVKSERAEASRRGSANSGTTTENPTHLEKLSPRNPGSLILCGERTTCEKCMPIQRDVCKFLEKKKEGK